jgi:regulator of replication initiation timing
MPEGDLMTDVDVDAEDLERQHRKTRDANRGLMLENDRLRGELGDALERIEQLEDELIDTREELLVVYGALDLMTSKET